MVNKKRFFLVLLTVFFIPLHLSGKWAGHRGERNQIFVDISFFGSSGKTVTDAKGTHYYFFGRVVHEDKVYPSRYWGTFPLFFFDRTVGTKVRVMNLGPRRVFKLRITTQASVLNTDGTRGAFLAPARQIEIEVQKGEIKEIDASFFIPYSSDAESGLDRFSVKVAHVNQGGGSGNPDPGIILIKEGVFCPPRFVQ